MSTFTADRQWRREALRRGADRRSEVPDVWRFVPAEVKDRASDAELVAYDATLARRSRLTGALKLRRRTGPLEVEGHSVEPSSERGTTR